MNHYPNPQYVINRPGMPISQVQHQSGSPMSNLGATGGGGGMSHHPTQHGSAMNSSVSGQFQSNPNQYPAPINTSNVQQQSQQVTPGATGSTTVYAAATAPNSENRPSDVVSRLKMLTDKQMKESLQKMFTSAIVAVNSQGGRDNGATDGDLTAKNNEYSNLALGQAVEECMSTLDQIELNLQLALDWANQLKVVDKFCAAQLPQISADQEQHMMTSSSASGTNLTTEEVLESYEAHLHYAEQMQSIIDNFVSRLDSESATSISNQPPQNSDPNLSTFPVVNLL